MRILETPYFLRVINDATRSTMTIEHIVAQIVRANETATGSTFSTWINFIQTVEAEACRRDQNDLARVAAQNFNSRLATACRDEGIFFPLMWLNDSRRFFQQHRSLPVSVAAEYLDNEFNDSRSIDNDYIEEHISEWHSIDYCADCESRGIYDTFEREALTNNLICTSCRDNHYVHSDYYDALVHLDHERTAYDANETEITIDERDRNFYFDESRDEYCHRSTRDRGVIRAYHSSKEFFAPINDNWTTQHNRHMGIELEVEAPDCDPRPIARKINDTANGGRVGERLFFERDGSLTNGFEIITQPMSLPMIRETFEFLKHPQNTAGLRSHRTTTCGLHVHVSRAGLTNITIGRAVTFVNDPRNDSFVMALARRYNTGYCKIVEKDPETAHLPADRYEAINLTPRNTIEFRLFRGSLKYDAVIAAAEFAHALLAFCARPETTSIEMNPRTFLLWCAANIPEDTKIMRDYVNQRTAGTFAIDVAA